MKASFYRKVKPFANSAPISALLQYNFETLQSFWFGPAHIYFPKTEKWMLSLAITYSVY